MPADTPPASPASTQRSYISKLWALTAPYWRSADWKLASFLSLAVIGLTLGSVYMDVVFNYWNRDFFNAIQNKDEPAFWHLIIKFTWLAAIFIFIGVYSTYLRQMLMIRWRRWLTASLMQRWLDNRVYYLLQLKDYGTDNPEQRIEQDVFNFTAATLTLTLGLINQIVTLFSFAFILWSISGPLSFALAGHAISIPGYMFWAAALYAIAGTYCAYRIGRPLVGINFMQERYNASFRFGMTRLRENAESVAFYGGEQDEKRRLDGAFDNVWSNWFRLMKRTKRLNWFSSFYGQAAIIFPFIVAAPRYFSGAIPLGVYTQIADAFGSVQTALSWFIEAFSSLAEWKASVNRLIIFVDAVDAAQVDSRQMNKLAQHPASECDLIVDDLNIALPNGQPLLRDVAFTITPGQRVLIAGPSGSGKTTLFRTLAGLWPFGHGAVKLPPNTESLFLPQKPYLPIAALREVVSFPLPPTSFSNETIRSTLADVELSHLADQLDAKENWTLVLSGGEQQRLAIARALLIKPYWLFLDEATSALDEPTEHMIYRLLVGKLPETSIISIAHRESLAKYHDTRLAIDPARQQVTLTALAPV
ncbi:MAG TPA: ABC transporter ATP-binding protein/permease [Dongiaceae bacterium]|nr:ABC transporter ATP-binding protein/permease [Dongiaceae bacterium]